MPEMFSVIGDAVHCLQAGAWPPIDASVTKPAAKDMSVRQEIPRDV